MGYIEFDEDMTALLVEVVRKARTKSWWYQDPEEIFGPDQPRTFEGVPVLDKFDRITWGLRHINYYLRD